MRDSPLIGLLLCVIELPSAQKRRETILPPINVLAKPLLTLLSITNELGPVSPVSQERVLVPKPLMLLGDAALKMPPRSYSHWITMVGAACDANALAAIPKLPLS